jgi:hypothetical protein
MTNAVKMANLIRADSVDGQAVIVNASGNVSVPGTIQSTTLQSTTVAASSVLTSAGNTALSTGNYGNLVTKIAGSGTGINYDINNRAVKQGGGVSAYSAYPGGINSPTTYDVALQVTSNGNQGWELVADWVSTPQPYIRALRDCCQNWSGWWSISIAAVSDRRRKTNITPITNHRDIIFSLQGTQYDAVNEDGTLGDVSDEDPDLRVERPKEFGYIAQDAIKTVPEVVKFNKRFDTPNDVGWANAYTIDYERLVPVVTESVKEIYTDMDALKELVNEMKSQIVTLQAEVAALKGK